MILGKEWIKMGVWEDVVLNAKTAVTAVGKKAGEMVDISKLRLSATEINREISNQFEEIGRMVYEAKKEETDNQEAVAAKMAAIDELYEQLDAVNDKLDELKKTVKCDKCGTRSGKGTVYCPKCGTKLDD